MTSASVFDFRELVELTGDAIIVRRRDGHIIFWNAGAERLYGWSASQAVGRISHELLATRFSQAAAQIDAALDGPGSWEGVLHQATAAGAAIVVSSRWVQRGDILFEINRDETERYRLEQVARAERQ
jgi:PAS domain S-box-containing protein